MSDDQIEGPRLVLRQDPAEPEVTRLAESREWELLADEVSGDEVGHSREKAWQVSSGLFVHLLEDIVSRCCCLVVTGFDAKAVADLTAQLTTIFHPMTRAELLRPIVGIVNPQERVRAVMRLALGSPPDFDPAFYGRVEETASDPEPGVRNAAIWVTGYVAWPEYRRLLRRVAAEDPDDRVRYDARLFLRMYDEAEVGEP